MAGTDSKNDTPLTRGRSRPVRDPHEERRKREAWALQIIKGMRKSPTAPEPPPEPLRPTFRADPEMPGWVYFAYCAGRIKIGYTNDPPKRMAQFTTHAPMPVILLLAIGGDEDDERDYHNQFAKERIHYEWFRLSLDLRDFLERNMDEDGYTLLFEAESDYHATAREDLAWITNLFKELEELNNERAAV